MQDNVNKHTWYTVYTCWTLICLMLVYAVYVCVQYMYVHTHACILQWHEHLMELRLAGPQLCENLIAFISQPAQLSPCLTLDMHYTWSLTWPDTSASPLWYIPSTLPWALQLSHTEIWLVWTTRDQAWIIFFPSALKIPQYCVFHSDLWHCGIYVCCHDIMLHWMLNFIIHILRFTYFCYSIFPFVHCVPAQFKT